MTCERIHFSETNAVHVDAYCNMNDGNRFYHLIRNEWRETANFIDKTWCMRTQKLFKKIVKLSLYLKYA